MDNKQSILSLNLNDSEMIEKVAQNLLAKMETGMTLKDALGVSDEMLEQLYSLAHGYYSQGKYVESLSIFYILSGASPDTYKFVLGLAASYHQLGGYREAASAFVLALNINPNPLAAYHLLECFLKLGMKEEAKQTAQIAIELCDEFPQEYNELKQRIQLIDDSIIIK